MISAKIIRDSINPSRQRITTWVLTYPRFIHSEFMTHRCFSRNAASSRAIPIEKMIQAVREEPAGPVYWGANQKGMQAAQELEMPMREQAQWTWTVAATWAANAAEKVSKIGLHKQIANRLLEPWAHMTVLATATAHANFFKLRAHPDAQPEFQVLAYKMLKEYCASAPSQLNWGDWHIPFWDLMPVGATLQTKLAIATARAARVSYTDFEGTISPEKDLALFEKLATSGHWSPFEHCAFAESNGVPSNFRGWTQYRKLFPWENAVHADYAAILESMPDWVKKEMLKP